MKPTGDAEPVARFVVVQGREVGAVYDLAVTPMTIGRDASNAIALDEVAVSRWHAVVEAERQDDGRLVLRDVGSKNGTRVNKDRVERHVLNDGDVVRIGTASLKFLGPDNEEQGFFLALARAAVEDGLTGLANRRYLETFLLREVDRATRYQSPLSVLMIDIDRFKAINDAHGHPVGDAALRELGHYLQGAVRSSELVARYGGEEFTVVLPETPVEGATTLGWRLCSGIAGLKPSVGDISVALSASIGAAEWRPGMSAADLVELADHRMYEGKERGGNQVVFSSRSRV